MTYGMPSADTSSRHESIASLGAPMLAMHSCRELASALDVPYVVDALTACFTD